MSTSASTSTRAGKERRYNRLLSRASKPPRTTLGASVMPIVKDILEDNPLTQDSLADPIEVMDTVLQMLPSPYELFALTSFLQAHLPVAILRDTLQFYDVPVSTDDIEEGFIFSDREKKDDKLNAFLYICALINADKAIIEYVIKQYRFSSSFGPLHQAPRPPVGFQSIGDPRTEPVSQDNRSTPDVHFAPGPAGTTTVTIPRMEESGGPGHTFRVDDSKKAVNVKQYFKDSEFTGEDLKHTIAEVVTEFEICSEQQNLTHIQKCKLLINCFKGTAKRFYLLNVRREMSFDERIAMMKLEYDSEARRNQVQAELESLTLSAFMTNRGISSENQGLSELINHINILHPQVPVVFQSDAVKLRYLRHAVFACPWAHTSLKKINDSHMSFTKMANALRGDLQFSIEQQGQHQSSTFKADVENPDDDVASTLFGRYGRNPKKFSSRGRYNNSRGRYNSFRGRYNSNRGRYNNPRNFPQELSNAIPSSSKQKRLCFGCGSPDHYVRDNKCKPSEMVNHFRDRLKSNVKHDTLLVGCIDYMVGQNAGNLSEDELEDSDTNAENTHHVNAATISALDQHFADRDEDDYDEDETYFTHFLASRMRSSDVRPTSSVDKMDFRHGGGDA